MNQSTSLKIKPALLAFAFTMLLYPAIFSPLSASSYSTPAAINDERSNSAGNPNLILFKQGALDTRARRDLDRAADELSLSNQPSALSQVERKQLRVVRSE